MVLERLRRSVIASDWEAGMAEDILQLKVITVYFLVSFLDLKLLSANFRTVSETSLFPDRFFRSCTKRCFIKPSDKSKGVRGLNTRFRTTGYSLAKRRFMGM